MSNKTVACDICGEPISGKSILYECCWRGEDCYRVAYHREKDRAAAAEARATAAEGERDALRVALQAFVEHWDDYDETTGLDVDDTRGIEILHAAKAALSAAPPNAMGAQPPAPASVPPAAAPQECPEEHMHQCRCGVFFHNGALGKDGPPMAAAAPQEQQGAAARTHAPASAASEPKAPPSAPSIKQESK